MTNIVNPARVIRIVSWVKVSFVTNIVNPAPRDPDCELG